MGHHSNIAWGRRTDDDEMGGGAIAEDLTWPVLPL
jgi:hypothetical protein